MTPEQAAHDTAAAVVREGGRFMGDPACYARGADLGFTDFDFYIAGRAGALGDVPADVVVAALVFFAPKVVHERWDRARGVMPPRDAAAAFAGWAHEWADQHLPDGIDYARLAALLGRVVDGAPVAGAPIFAGWRTLSLPTNPKALALHHLNGVREMRGALHGAAILTVGLTPIEAMSVRSPKALKATGWDVEPLDPKPFAERWQLAEARTDRMVGRRLAVLDAAELDEFVELCGGLHS
jgi:hypothetical protein